MISFEVEDRDGITQTIEVPEGISLSLMEVLKSSEYDIAATCGGMALCATCMVQVLKGAALLPEPTDAELDMLDTLPYTIDGQRLSCQIPLSEVLDGCMFKLPG